jgi:hypothetical protein
MIPISARFARAVNRVFLRVGRVIAGRYHVQLLKSPTQVRNALRYVLLNIRKHFKQRYGQAPPVKIDAASSGSQFDGWRPSPGSLRTFSSHPRRGRVRQGSELAPQHRLAQTWPNQAVRGPGLRTELSANPRFANNPPAPKPFFP